MQTTRLLVIDDNAAFLRGLRRFLDTQNCVLLVGELENGRTVLDHIRTLQPDVVVTDLAMPDVSGFTIIDQIRRQYPRIGIVALTLYDNQEYRQGALEAGAHAFVTKSELKEKLIPAVMSADQTAHHHDAQA